ncbi:hypothetical protein GCM10027275_25240 [Rhabdobacter roseus]|uniref:Apea-like HEPN domain-containing protein n=1 Tax=Rhabdobacter roseus TaxID=1655419 RepID=A0A840TNF7_9BACT|nr:HEPN domain-containing protein [Rhabdobacter roseus]MBB5284465.1 hypothetical protein [Rhabdobacter roseus]
MNAIAYSTLNYFKTEIDLKDGRYPYIFIRKNGGGLISNFINTPSIIQQIGGIDLISMAQNPILTVEYNYDELCTYFEIIDPNKLCLKINEAIAAYINLLWLIKDNSVCSTQCWLNVDGKISRNSRRDFFSNCNGTYCDVAFSLAELNKVVASHKRLTEFISKKDYGNNINLDDPILRSPSINPSDLNFAKYIYNRVERAFKFLHLARSHSFLPMKISFYIVILECLFTTENHEITHKVSERATIYLGGDKNVKLNNFKRIKEAYDIRSKYMHGQALKKNIDYNELCRISKSTDDIVRKILNKVLFEDGEIFMKKDDELASHYNTLIFT